jgi:hypothetical protein
MNIDRNNQHIFLTILICSLLLNTFLKNVFHIPGRMANSPKKKDESASCFKSALCVLQINPINQLNKYVQKHLTHS